MEPGFRKRAPAGWQYSDPQEHEFAWMCEMCGFDMPRFDDLLDDEELVSALDRATLMERRAAAFEAYKRNDMDLLRERLSYLLLAGTQIKQGRAAAHDKFVRLAELSDLRVKLSAQVADDVPGSDKPEARGTPSSESMRHSTSVPRRDLLTPVVELAQSKCRKPTDAAEVWAALLVLAESKEGPLLGVTEEGVQYRTEKGEGVEYLNRRALTKRLKRMAAKSR